MGKTATSLSARLQHRLQYDGPLFLKQGFRPFFLAAGVWSSLAMAIWLGLLFHNDRRPLTGYFSDIDWHIHEMLFGYLSAAIAGFLLTAVPNWTGRLPVRGNSLAALALLWLAGRLVILISGIIPKTLHISVALIDSLFLIVFTLLLAREIFAGKNRKNVPVIIIIGVLALCNGLFHLSALDLLQSVSRQKISLAALLLAVLLVGLIGGRVVPSFTRNWLVRNKIEPLPASRDLLDQLGATLLVSAALALLLAPDFMISGVLMLVTAAIHFYRLSRWQGWRTLREPLVIILHVGYGWVGVGFLLAGISILTDVVPYMAVLHAFSAGMLGTMTLAIMTRASRGHTRNPLEADRGTTAIYTLVSLSAIIRVATAFTDNQTPGYILSGLTWVAAFALFSVLYFPLFAKDRKFS